MTKKEFFESIDEMLYAEIFLTDNLDELLNETGINHLSMSIDSETAKNIENYELEDFLKRVIKNRKTQLEKSNKDMDLVFYSWFDELSGRLHFDFINSKHEKLPFNSELNFVDSINIIIEKFIDTDYLDYLEKASWEELEDSLDEDNHALDVYKEIIKKH